MARLKTVEVYPYTRSLTGRWDADVDVDAFLGAVRGVCELVSEAVRGLGLTNRRSYARFFVRASPYPRFQVDVARSHDPDMDEGTVHVAAGFASRTAEQRVATASHIVLAALDAIGARQGWPEDALTSVADHVRLRGLRFAHVSAWKPSRDRVHEAAGTYLLDAQGLGRAQLVVRRRDDHEVVARSEPAPAFMHWSGITKSAATLRWASTDEVSFAPWVDAAGRAGDPVSLDLRSATVAAEDTEPAVDPGSTVPVSTRLVPPRALARMDEWAHEQSQVWLADGGIWLEVPHATSRIRAAWDDVLAETRDAIDGAAWLSGSWFLNVQVQLVLAPRESDLGGTAKYETQAGTELLTTLLQSQHRLNRLADDELRDDLRGALLRHLRAVGRRRNLPPFPA